MKPFFLHRICHTYKDFAISQKRKLLFKTPTVKPEFHVIKLIHFRQNKKLCAKVWPQTLKPGVLLKRIKHLQLCCPSKGTSVGSGPFWVFSELLHFPDVFLLPAGFSVSFLCADFRFLADFSVSFFRKRLRILDVKGKLEVPEPTSSGFWETDWEAFVSAETSAKQVK